MKDHRFQREPCEEPRAEEELPPCSPSEGTGGSGDDETSGDRRKIEHRRGGRRIAASLPQSAMAPDRKGEAPRGAEGEEADRRRARIGKHRGPDRHGPDRTKTE